MKTWRSTLTTRQRAVQSWLSESPQNDLHFSGPVMVATDGCPPHDTGDLLNVIIHGETATVDRVRFVHSKFAATLRPKSPGIKNAEKH